MASPALTKPHITLTGKAVWQCADAHLSRSGRSWKQAYDRWLLASLRDAASVANLCQPAATAPVKRGRPRKIDKAELNGAVAAIAKPKKGGPAGGKNKVMAELNQPVPVATAAKILAKRDELAEFRKIAGSALATPLRQPGSAKRTVSKSAPTVPAIEQPSYSALSVRQLPASTRREYSPPAGLLRNMDRAAAVQQPLISISTGDRSPTR